MSVTTAVLGGEVRHRSVGMRSPWIRNAVMFVLVIGLGLAFTWVGLILGVVISGLLYIASLSNPGDNSAVQKWDRKLRWNYQVKHGYHVFKPVALRPVNCKPGREWNAYRDWPDGIDQWTWLEDQPNPGATAICHHNTPAGDYYFSVTFRVDGPLVGLVGDDELEDAQTRFGNLLAGWGSRQKLVSGLQITTRMLPARTDLHQAWMSARLDPATHEEQTRDYAQLLNDLSAHGLIQRHYVTVRWDQTARFDLAAAERGKGAAGRRALIEQDTDSVGKRLKAAGYTDVQPLTGPALAAVLRHLQNPGFHPDQTADVTAAGMYRPSVASVDRVTTDGQWTHRTAVFPIRGIETSQRNGLWMHPLLGGMESQIIRTLSIHITLVPASDAKTAARRDATADQVALITARDKGHAADDETEVALTAAQQRLADMSAGTGHHGVLWAGVVTLSVPATESLVLAVNAVEEAADACGINHLQWCDSYQAAAQCATWPMARLLPPAPLTKGARVLETVSLRAGRIR